MEKRGQSKRSQSEVITTVLIILLVLVAIIIVYVAVRNIIIEETGQAGSSTSSLNIVLTTTGVAINPSANSVEIPVSRKAGAGNVSEIRIIFKNSGGAIVCTYSNKTDTPKELETTIYFVMFADIGCPGTPASYEVYHVIISGGREVIGMKATVSTSVGGGGGGNTVACSVSTQCGTSGFSGNLFCGGGDIRQKNVTWTCKSPGTTNSSCSSITVFQLNKSCYNYGCQMTGGVGGSIPVCNPAVSGCSAESECGIDGFTGSKFCNATDSNLYQNYTNYICSSPSCSSVVSSMKNETCYYGCSAGACKPTPNSSLPECLITDVDGDADVDWDDSTLVISAFAVPNYRGYADVTSDCVVNGDDWTDVKAAFGLTTASPCRQRALIC